MSIFEEVEDAISKLQNSPTIRVKTPVAKRLLLTNEYVQIKGAKRFLRLKNLGLGVYEVSIADVGGKAQTIVIK